MVARRLAGGPVCTVRDGVILVEADGSQPRLVVDIEASLPHLRMNDAACDPAGRLWAGTMATDLTPSQGTLYRIGTDLEVTAVRPEVSVSNGMDWSHDRRTFYYTDSTTRAVDAYDFEVGTGELGYQRRLIEMPDAVATPDGLTVDMEGNLWIAMWDGGCVRRYSPQGRLLDVIEIPVIRPTSVAFGGENLDRLFVTSARNGLSDGRLAAEPQAGAIFVIGVGVTGRPPHPFGG